MRAVGDDNEIRMRSNYSSVGDNDAGWGMLEVRVATLKS